MYATDMNARTYVSKNNVLNIYNENEVKLLLFCL